MIKNKQNQTFKITVKFNWIEDDEDVLSLDSLTIGAPSRPHTEKCSETADRFSARTVTTAADRRKWSDGSAAEASGSDRSITVTEVGSGSTASVALVSRWSGARLVGVELASVAEAFGTGLGNLDVAASLYGASGNVAEVSAGGIGARSLGKSLKVLFLSGKWENLNISKTKKLDLNLFYPNVPIRLWESVPLTLWP